MTIKQQGGVFGRNPTFNDVTVDGTLTSSNLDVSDQITTVGSSKAAAVFDRTTTVGDIIDLKYNGASIGSIGTNYGFVLIGNEDTYLSFRDSQADIVPAKASGNSKNGSVSLGASSSKFNNIYLAGNVIVDSGKGIDFSATSGTGTSELFDDYEEGTFTPTVSDGTLNATFAGLGGRYTKIGRVVHIEIYFININTSGLTSGSTMRVGGLPFTHVTSTFNNAILNTQAHTLASTNGAVSAALGSNLSYMILIDGTSTSISNALTVAAVTSGTTDLYISGTYEAA